MAKPLSGLKPALELLAQSVDILPATGQAAAFWELTEAELREIQGSMKELE